MIPIPGNCLQILPFKNRYETDIRYAQDSPYPTDTDIPNIPHTNTDTGFIPIFFIQIPIPGIGTWYWYHTGYRSNSIA